MRFALILSVLALAVSGCALRARYADFVTSKTEGKEVTFVVIDNATSKPVPGAKIEISELKNRLNLTTGADGTFKVPNEKKYLDENPVFVVSLPAGVVDYKVILAPTPVVVPDATDAADAGSNG